MLILILKATKQSYEPSLYTYGFFQNNLKLYNFILCLFLPQITAFLSTCISFHHYLTALNQLFPSYSSKGTIIFAYFYYFSQNKAVAS